MLKKTVYFFTILAFLIIVAFLLWIQIKRYKPEPVSLLQVHQEVRGQLSYGDSLDVFLWNISYGGMPSSMDFFYSGGDKMILPEVAYKENIKHISNLIEKHKSNTSIFLFQNIDTASDRSYRINQYQFIKNILPGFESAYCLNFSNPYIPVPLNEPIGQIYSGMSNMSKVHAASYNRISFNSKQNYYWPKRLFTSQKCMLVSSYPIQDKFLFVINAHLNSYDWQGRIRITQLKQVYKIADSLYNEGHYVVVAGGWNMNPPGFKKYRIKHGYKAKPAFPEIDTTSSFINWQFEYNSKIPTSRSLMEAYRHGAINSTIKDFFICSPNITILEAETINEEFQSSNHHPVLIKVLLKEKTTDRIFDVYH